MSTGAWHKQIYPQSKHLPKFIVMVGCDADGNLEEHKYIHEKEIEALLVKLDSGINLLRSGYNMIGGDE